MAFRRQFPGFLSVLVLMGPLIGTAAEASASDLSLSDLQSLSLEELLNLELSSASKSTERLREAPGSVTVITRQQIEQMNALTLRDVLNVFVPGLDVVPTYFRYGDRVNEGIYSRGLLSDFSQQILILYNGQNKFNETTFASPFVAVEFTLENVEQIEVSRSPVPLHGGSAMTVINIVTREQNLDGVEAKVNIGANGPDLFRRGLQSKRATGIVGVPIGKWHLSGSLQYYDDDGQAHPIPAANGGYTGPRDTLRDGTKAALNFTASLRAPDDRVTLQTWYKSTNRDAFLSGQVPSQNNDLYNYRGTTWLNRLTVKVHKTTDVTVGGTMMYWANTTDFLGVPFGGAEYNYDVFVEAVTRHKWQWVGEHNFVAGARVEREGQHEGVIFDWNGHEMVPDTDPARLFAPNISRTVLSAFAENRWKPLEPLAVTLGLRVDYYHGFGAAREVAVNPRVALNYQITHAFALKALYASAVRPPSIYELLGSALVPLLGQANLSSERLQTVELGGVITVGGLKLQLAAFFQDFQRKIEYVPNGLGQSVATNNGRTSVAGGDIDLHYAFSRDTYIFLNASQLHSFDRQARALTPFLASTYVNAGTNVRIGPVNLNLVGYFRGPRSLPANLIVNSAYAGSHFNANASVAYWFLKKMKVYFLVENVAGLINPVPLSADGLVVPNRGRTFNLGLAYVE